MKNIMFNFIILSFNFLDFFFETEFLWIALAVQELILYTMLSFSSDLPTFVSSVFGLKAYTTTQYFFNHILNMCESILSNIIVQSYKLYLMF